MSSDDLKEIRLKLEHVTEKVLEHLEADKNDHLAVRARIDASTRLQEKFADKLSTIDVNLVKVITVLDNLVDKATINDREIEKMDAEFNKLRDKLSESEKKLSNHSTVVSTVIKVFAAIGGLIGAIWTIIQMVSKITR